MPVVALLYTGGALGVGGVVPASATPAAAEPSYVAAANEHSCGRTTNETIVCWGSGALGATAAPPSTAFRSVIAEGNYSCGLAPSGAPSCWGNGLAVSLLSSLAPGTVFTQIQGGPFHVCGVTPAAGVACWGSGGFNQLTVPANLDPTAAVTAGGSHSCALSTTGGVRCWGRTSEGQALAPAGETFVQISAGAFHTCGVTTGGDVRCWGSDSFGQSPALTAGPFAQVSAGSSHTCALRTDGAAVCWGYPTLGATAAPAAERFDEISAGGDHTCGLTQIDGRIVCWGRNASGQTNAPALMFGPVPPDTTAPVVTGTPSRDPDSAGWYRSPVGVTWSVDDPTATQPPASLIAVEGAASSATSAPSCDPAGNCATGTFTVRLDLTPPSVSLIAPVDGARVAQADYVAPACTATDPLSGVAGDCSVTIVGPTTVLGGYTETVSATATDLAGNTATTAAVTYTVVTDTEGPTITVSSTPSPNAAGWWRSAVTFQFTCDDPSGVVACPDEVTLAAEGAGQSFTVTATDALGTTTTRTVSGVQIDLTAPSVDVVAPDLVGPAGTVTITCAASDALSGVAVTDCADRTIPASALDPGPNTFTFTATDVAGNTTTVTRTVNLVVVDPGPTVLADMGVAGLDEVGFQTGIVVLTGSFVDPSGPGPYTVSVRWSPGGRFTKPVHTPDGRFTVDTVILAATPRTVTVKICDASGACGTDDVRIRTWVRERITPTGCVVDRGPGTLPRYEAHWGYWNPAPYAIAIPSVLWTSNAMLPQVAPSLMPRVFRAGTVVHAFTTPFGNTTMQTWILNGRLAVTTITFGPVCSGSSA